MKKVGIWGLLVLIVWAGWRAQPTWIDVSGGGALPNGYFVVMHDSVRAQDIGRLAYVLSPPNHFGPETSNRLPLGTQIYTVRGKSPTQELAVEIHTGDFVRAIYAGIHRPW